MLVLRPRIFKHIAGVWKLAIRSVVTSPSCYGDALDIPVQPGDVLSIHAECACADIAIHQGSHDVIHVQVGGGF